MKKAAIAILLFLVLGCLSGSARAQEKQAAPELSKKWRTWLTAEVGYIISERERELFMQLTTEEQRERFVEEFWLTRDPTPGTPKNERKDEHYERLAYANKYLGRDTPRPGWMTDRGKYHIILGKPKQVESWPSAGEAYPCELWFYQADPVKGVPPFFYLLFFQRHGSGEYVLYNPLMDGPTALTTGAQARTNEAAYEVLYYMSPELANAAISFLVDDGGGRGRTTPSLGTLTLLSQIENIKNVGVDSSYADRILLGQARVETQYTFSGTELDTTVFPAVSDFDAAVISYAVQVSPQQMNVGQYKDTVYGTLIVETRVATAEGLTVSEKDHTIELNLTEDEFSQISNRPLLYMDQLPAIPGTYSVSVQVKNPLTKELFLMTREVVVPELSPVAPTVGPLLLGWGSEQLTEAQKFTLRPFQYAALAITPNPSGWYSNRTPIFLYCQIAVPEAMRTDASASFDIAFSLLNSEGKALTGMQRRFSAAQTDARGLFHLATTMPISELPSGAYAQAIKVTFSSGESFTRIARFSISENDFPPPNLYQGAIIQPADGALDYAIGTIWRTIGNEAEAERSLARAASRSGNRTEYARAYADQLLESGKFAEVIAQLEEQLIEKPRDPELLLLAGKAYLGQQEFSRAVKMFERLRLEDGGSVATLNLLADAYLGTGNREKAVEIWRLSLEKDEKQDDIKAKLEAPLH